MNLEEKTVKSIKIYDGIIVKLYLDDVICPNDLPAKREVIRHPGGAAILCVDDNKILLIKQFRYPYKEVIYEIPAGKLEKNEDPMNAAFREFEEETGRKTDHLEFLGKIYPTVGYTDEIIYLYLAKDYKKTQTHLDRDEFIETLEVTIDEFKEMIKDGRIKDAKTIAAFTYYMLREAK